MTTVDGKLVIGVGLACLDQLLIWKDVSLPVKDNKIVESDTQGGGMAATAMAAIVRLGGKAALWSAVGDDWIGERIVQLLNDDGIDTTNVELTVNGTSFFMVVCVDQTTGERHFMHMSDWTRPEHEIGDLTLIPGAGCLLIDHALPESELSAAKKARYLEVPVVSDTNGFGEWQREILPLVDYAIVSERGARSLSNDLREACDMIRDLGAGCVVVTLGEKGLVYLDGETFGSLPAFDVEVVDTTGAGDVFHGAFCYGLVEGFSLEENLIFSSATSALKCRRIGGRAGIPDRNEVDDFVRGRDATWTR